MIYYAHAPVSRLITRLAIGLAGLLLLVPTCIYAWWVHHEAGRDLDASMHFQVKVVEQFIQRQPDLWQDNAPRLTSNFEPVMLPGEFYRLSTSSGTEMFRLGETPAWHYLHRTRPVHSYGEVVGQLEAAAPMLPSIAWGCVMFATSAILAWVVAIPIRRLPLEALEKAEAELQAQQLGLEDKVKSRTAELALALDAAKEASRAKTDFVSSMSHELRTPLNAILGFAQLLEMDKTLKEDQADAVKEVRMAGEHLLALINEVLDLGRIESGNLLLSVRQVRLGPLLDECFSLVSGAAEVGRIELRREAGCEVNCRVTADPLRLKQVLVNLMSNAVKYNRPGGIVRIACEIREDGWLRLAVHDTGLGIPLEKQGALFTPFSRLGREAGNIQGTGIGLAISKRMVELMGGRIGFSSREGEGSCFWVELSGFDLASEDNTACQGAGA